MLEYLIEFIALIGQASTHILQTFPTHFSLLNWIVKSSATLIASTGHRATHEPQLKHLFVSTSISLGTVTVAPFLRKADMTVSTMSS